MNSLLGVIATVIVVLIIAFVYVYSQTLRKVGLVTKVELTTKESGREVTALEILVNNRKTYYVCMLGHSTGIEVGDNIEFWPTLNVEMTFTEEKISVNRKGQMVVKKEVTYYLGMRKYRIIPYTPTRHYIARAKNSDIR